MPTLPHIIHFAPDMSARLKFITTARKTIKTRKPNMTEPKNPLTQEGMTLRDYFAAAALTGMLSHIQAVPQKCVDISFEIADAMLKAREQ